MARNKYDTDEVLTSSFNIQHFGRAIIYAKRHAKLIIIALICSIVGTLSSLLYPMILEHAFNVTIPEKNVKQLILLTFLTIATILVSIAMTTVRSRLMAIVGQKIVYEMRRDLFEHLQKLPFQYYDDRPQGKILTRVIHYVNNVSDMLSNGIINFILDLLNLIFIGFFMFTMSKPLALIVIAGTPIFIALIFTIKPAQRKAWQLVSNKGSNLNAYTQESIDGAKLNQLFVREDENAVIYDRLNHEYRSRWIKALYISNTVWFTVENLSVWTLGAMYLVGILLVNPAVPFGTIIAMSNYAGRFWEPLLNLSNLYNSVINSIAYLERIFEMMDEPVVVDDCEGATELPPIEGGVTFDDVTFAYVPGTNILENLSFEVKPGESIALVGPTGAGKTTVVNLISRFYNLSGGRVLIDGHDISKVTLHSLRSQMGIMLQDSFIFSGTIADNIRYGRLDAPMEDVRKACRTVCADEFIMDMPD
ncbi:MAG: ABC transporter ATP-binding protein, partial [Oscillospiraceae bacterium]|nr:ABC transporter ATP-binding protein [Oscillospiraceae bacterium]